MRVGTAQRCTGVAGGPDLGRRGALTARAGRLLEPSRSGTNGGITTRPEKNIENTKIFNNSKLSRMHTFWFDILRFELPEKSATEAQSGLNSAF